MFYLYTITNLIANKVYVGQTINPQKRWSQHKAYAKRNKPIQYIHRAMFKYGIENFVFEVIATCCSQENADATEQTLISQFNSRNNERGYNLSPGGDIAWNRGLPKEQQPMYGKHHSKSSKEQIAISNTGIRKPKHTEEWKEFMSSAMTGREITWKQKISESRTKFDVKKESKIASEYKNGVSAKILADKYGCTTRTIFNIINRRKRFDK